VSEHSVPPAAGIDIWHFIDLVEDYAVLILDQSGLVRTWNRGARRIMGYEAGEIIGRSVELFYPAEDVRAGKPAGELVEAARLGRFEDEGWRVRKDGSRFWANIVITAGRDERGELDGFIKVTRDVTERERERRLREEQVARAAAEAGAERLAVLRSVTEASLAMTALGLPKLLDELTFRVRLHVAADAAGVLLVDAAGEELTLSAAHGFSPGTKVGGHVAVGRGIAGRIAAARTALVVPDVSAVEAAWPALWEQMKSAAGVPMLAEGALLGVLMVATRKPRSFSDEDLNLLRLIADIVAAAIQRVRVHTALTEGERRFRATFELAPVGVAQVGLDGRWLRVNGALCSMVGYSADELSAKTFQSITHPDDLPHDMELIAQLTGGSIDQYAMQKRYFHRNGEVVWVQLTVSLVRGDDGRPAYFISVIEDIRARKRAHEERELLLAELREALSARDRFLSTASHELRTPLTALMLQVRRLTDARSGGGEPALPPPVAGRVAAMSRQIDQLAALVEELLDVARIHEGRLRLHAEEVDLGALVREVVERFEEQAAQAMTPIDVTVREPVTGWWDRLRLDEVLTNLVSNAVKYGDHHPVSIVVGAEGDRARVLVADRGIGIRREDRGRLFGRFERLSPDPSIGGIGLGLWITHEIVDALGGTIGVESEPGRGTTFVVELPRRAA
jgi:PAS domain S-box-containing protein